MRRLASLAGGFAAAVFLFVYALSPGGALVLAGVCLAVGLGACFVRKEAAKRAALILLSFGVGLGYCCAYWQFFLAPLDALDGQTLAVSVTATGYDAQTPYGSAIPVSFTKDGRTYRGTLYTDEKRPIAPGDRLSATANLRVTGDRPGEAASYLGAKGKSLTFSVRGRLDIQKQAGLRLRHWPAAFSHRLIAALDGILTGDAAHFLKALVAGERSGLSFSVSNDLSVAGLYHAVAISGMHISILLGMLLLLLGSRRRLAALMGLPLIWFYAFAVGGGAPVLRAAIMQSFLLLAPLCKRENDVSTSLLTALALILLPNPRAAGDVALQMSFASLAGILLFSNQCFSFFWEQKAVKKLRKRSRFLSAVLKTVLASFAASLAVMPMTLPLSAAYFGIFSLVAPPSSILVLPVISLCFSYGLLVGLVGMVSVPLGTILAWPLQFLVGYCTKAAHALAQIPFAAIYANSAYMVIFLLFLYGVILFFALGKRKCSLLVPASCTAGMLCLCLLLGSWEFDRAQATVTMLDVGQGQCVYLESGGAGAVYDCGGSGEKTGELAARYLASVGRKELGSLIISHYDADHAEGAAYLLSRIRVKTVYLPRTSEESAVQEEIVEAAEKSGANVIFLTQDVKIPFGNGNLHLFAPVSARSDNDGCLAALLSVADFDALLTGDMSVYAEQTLLLTHELPDIEVMAAGHHGAKTSTSAALLRRLRPETVLISVGARNSYGHPAEETLGRLTEAHINIYRTDLCGNITVRR